MAWQSQTLDSPLRSLAHTQSLRAHHPVAINKTFAGFSYQTAATPRFLVGKTRTQPTAPLPLPLAPRGGAAGQGGFLPPPLLRGSARAVTPSERSPRRRPEPPRGRSRASRPTTSAAGSARRRAPQPPGRASQVRPQASAPPVPALRVIWMFLGSASPSACAGIRHVEFFDQLLWHECRRAGWNLA